MDNILKSLHYIQEHRTPHGYITDVITLHTRTSYTTWATCWRHYITYENIVHHMGNILKSLHYIQEHRTPHG